MFYSHEVLTSRKYGVATVWLVATLGSKSTLKKVSRKAILDVNVAKACETIVEPEAPLALRLQSNLLYGVSRVYLQQCGYVLADAESANMAMRTMLRSIRATGLDDEGANKARPDQLILQDDPNFLPDLDLMALDLDQFDLNRPLEDSQSDVSPYGSSQRISDSQQSIGGLMLPPSHSSFLPGPVGGLDLLSVRGDSGPGKKLKEKFLEEEIELGLDDDHIMADEPLHGRSAAPTAEHHVAAVASDGAAPRIQSDLHSEQPNLDFAYDDGFVAPQDDGVPLPQDGDAAGGPPDAGAPIIEQETTSETASASIARRKRVPRTLPLDNETTHPNRVLARWNEEYLEKMKESTLSKQGYKLAALAKKNAQHWVLGNGVSLNLQVCASLEMFTGAALIEAFTGIDLVSGGQKRKRDAVENDVDGLDSDRRVRPRGAMSPGGAVAQGDQDVTFTDGILQDDGYLPVMDEEDTIEQGRAAPTPLADQHLSSIFPWNQSAGSRRPTDPHATSTSMGGGGLQLNTFGRGRRGSRLTSASPLVGRQSLLPANDNDNVPFLGSDINMDGMTGDEEFELFGPAAQVDTQTAAQSQWQRAVLGSESANFLDFVKTAIAERAGVDGHDEDDYDAEHYTGSVDLDELLPPKENSHIVAAQAMLHLLALGTKNLLRVVQQEAFGPISLSMIGV